MSNKIRLDVLLVEKGLANSRTKAQALIMAGQVKSGEKLLTKSGFLLDPNSELSLKQSPKYVSRGGLKLESVVQNNLVVLCYHKTVLDVGSSTGGFTDFALQNGATKVYAVDVGKGQLDAKLRADSRVVVMEQTDIRKAELPEKVDLILIDVSFISLRKVLEPASRWLKSDGQILAMAKPQFEATKEVADRFKGVIKDEAIRNDILTKLENDLKSDFDILASSDSGLTGAEGNLERFYLLTPRL